VWAAFRFGVIMARIALRLKEIGLPTPTPDFESNNVATQALARLLGLPAPGSFSADPKSMSRGGRVQIRLTGPGGCEWWLEAGAAGAERHEGTAEAPDVTVTAAASDWEAIQSGALSRTEAFFSGRLKIDGDTTLLLALEDAISKLSAAPAKRG
jgi:putative sterol carrier protein